MTVLRHTITRNDSLDDGKFYNFGHGLPFTETNGDVYKPLKFPIGLTRYVAIDDDSDVRGVMVREPNSPDWKQLREGMVLKLQEDVEELFMSRLDRTSGVLRLASSTKPEDVECMRSHVRNFARLQFDTNDDSDLRDLYLHMPRFREGRMRWTLRTYQASGTDAYTVKAHSLMYAQADANQSEFQPSRERGNLVANLENTSIATGNTTSGAADTFSGLVDAWMDVLEVSFAGSVQHIGTFSVGPA